MANPEHLDILKQGVEVWNRWRENNPKIIPELRNLKLPSEKLNRIDFNYANLYGANLSEKICIPTS